MNEIKVLISFEKRINRIIGVDLTSGDYNSTKLIFDFDRQDGTKVFELKNPRGELVFAKEIENSEIILARVNEDGTYSSLFDMSGDYIFEVSLYTEDGKLTSEYEILPVEAEQVVIGDTVVEPYLPIFDELIQKINIAITETDNLDIDIENSIITITKKDGTTKSENIKGETGEIGPPGPEGPEGPPGEKGETAITVNIGRVETADSDTPANVTNSGTDKDLVLDFVLPKGEVGYTPVKGKDYFDGKDYSITDADYQNIADIVEKDIKPTLDNNLNSAKDYTDNAIIRDFKDISYNENTATFVFTRHDNTTFTVDLPIEQTVKNGYYDDENKELVLVLVSNQEIKIPASGLIDDYDGVDSATIQCVVSADNKITCNIISGSISKTLLTTELQQEINNKVDNNTFATELEKKVNTVDVETKELLITYQDQTTETIKLVIWK